MNDQHALNRERYAQRIKDWLVEHMPGALRAPGIVAVRIRAVLATEPGSHDDPRAWFRMVETLMRERRPASDTTWLRVAELLEMRCAVPADPFTDEERSDTR